MSDFYNNTHPKARKVDDMKYVCKEDSVIKNRRCHHVFKFEN